MRSPAYRSTTALAAFLVAVPCHAQQSLFNVPSGTSTVSGGAFLQEQMNFGSIGESNFTAELGLPWQLEVGFNLLRVDLYGTATSRSARAALTGNLSWNPQLTENWSLQFGAAAGGGQDETTRTYQFLAYGWGVSRYRFGSTGLTSVIGIYAGTPGWLGPGWPLGPMAGLDFEVWPEHMTLMADLLLGDQETAVGVVGPVLLFPYGWQVSLGVQLPSPLSRNEYEAVIELTHVPLDAGD